MPVVSASIVTPRPAPCSACAIATLTAGPPPKDAVLVQTATSDAPPTAAQSIRAPTGGTQRVRSNSRLRAAVSGVNVANACSIPCAIAPALRSTTVKVNPASTSAGTIPTFVVTTGKPAATASSTGSGPDSLSEAQTNTSIPAYQPGISAGFKRTCAPSWMINGKPSIAAASRINGTPLIAA